MRTSGKVFNTYFSNVFLLFIAFLQN